VLFGLATARLGWMLSSPRGSGVLRGNGEILVAVFAGPILEGPGSALGGGDLLLRYNFVRPNARLVPDLTIGSGAVYSDAAEADSVQRLIGRHWSFDLLAGGGTRFFLDDRWALTAELIYRHLSNADSAARNTGLNSVGGSLGVSYAVSLLD
jgi:opacity protein-like surface antigen